MQIPIPFSDPVSRTSPLYNFGENFGIWSCRFSADGNEVVAGGSGKIFGQSLALDLNRNVQHLKTKQKQKQFMIYWPTREQLKFLHTLLMLTVAVGRILTPGMSS